MSLVEDDAEQPQRGERGRLVPGARLNPHGRPKGNRNKLGEAFIGDLHDRWMKRGLEAIDKVIDTKPDQFLRVIASLMPRDVNLTVRQLDELSDEQLLSRLRQVTEMARPLLIDAKAIESPAGAIEDVPVVIEPAKR
jgi:hypothetical protein